jgi:hypothetical protein
MTRPAVLRWAIDSFAIFDLLVEAPCTERLPSG